MAFALVLVLVFAAAGAAARPFATEVTREGVVSIRCGEITGELSVVILGPEWSYASQAGARMEEAFPAGVVAAGQSVRGSGAIEMPKGGAGEVRFTQEAKREADRIAVSYSLTPSAASPVWLMALVLRVPVSQLEGKQGRILGLDVPFSFAPRAGFDGIARGISLPMGGAPLSVVADMPGRVRVEDARAWGGDCYEFRFVILDHVDTIAGAPIRRMLTIGPVEADDLKELAAMTTVDRSRPFAIGRADGDVEVWRDALVVGCHLVVFGPGWGGAGSTGASASGAHDATSRSARGTLIIPGTDGAQAVYTAWAEAGGGGEVTPFPGLFESAEEVRSVRIRYRIEFTQAPALRACRVAFRVPVARHKGREVVVLGAETPARFVVAETYPGTPGIWSGEARGVDIAAGTEDHVVVASSRPIYLNIQDNREWHGDEIEVGFHLPLPEGPVPAGYATEGEFTIAAAGLQFVPDASVAPSSNQTAEWFAFPLSPAAAPVDLSWLNHKPAGAHGFVTVREGQLAFEDGTPARFWGTCFSAGACFPTHENAEMIARRLAQVGVNIARLHHMDSDWGDVRLIDKPTGDTRHFDPESLDRLDYFIHCLKREGVYVYLDNLVNRKFTEKDGVEAADRLERKAPPYLYFAPRLIELQKEYCTNLWTHRNPYTGLRYCDDPAIAVTEIVNEADAFTSTVVVEPYRSRLAERFRAWMRARGLEAPAEVDFTKKTGRMSEFLTEVMAEYFGQMRAHLRSLGVRVPVNGTNWSINSALLVAMEGMDLFDSHAYQCHPSGDGTFANVPLVSEHAGAFCGWLAFNRVNGKPFSCSEWGEPWPNEWRAEMPLHLAYVAALQGWDGMAIYTYHHSAGPPPNYITGYFEAFNDPTLFGLFPHAALLYRRGDAAGARKRVAVKLGGREEAMLNPIGGGVGALSAVETHRLEVVLPGREATGVDEVVGPDETGEGASPVRSDTGEYERHFESERRRGYAVIRTPRTAAAYGFLGGRGEIDAGAAVLDITTDFAVVAVSSLSESAIAESDDLLVTAVGRAENNRQVFDITHHSLVSRGEGPIMVEPIRGAVTIRTRRKDLRCYGLDAAGRVLGEVALTPTADGVALGLGTGPKTIYWRICARDLAAG